MKKDSIVWLDYDAWIVETNELFDTTNEELAKSEDIYSENVKYKPQPLIVGAKTVVKGLDDALLNAEPDKEYELEISPEDAYGKRDPKLVELHTKREIMRLPEFRKGDKDPYVGMQISLKGKMGTITAITAGRVRVDFNNKLAGRTLKYKYKITSSAEKIDEKIMSIIEIHYGSTDDFTFNQHDDFTEIIIPDVCKFDQRWYLVKHRIATDLQKYADITVVRFTEEYKKKEEDAPEKAVEDEKSAGETTGEKTDDVGKSKSGDDSISVETSDKEESEDVQFSIEQEVPETGEQENTGEPED